MTAAEPLPDLLLPRPREIAVGGPALAMPGAARVSTDGELELPPQARRLLQDALEAAPKAGGGSEASTALRLQLQADDRLPAEGYRLRVAADGCLLVGADAAGLFYGCCTLAQWIGLHRGRGEIAALQVADSPTFRHRGVLLDVSRNKVPTMETLFELVDRLSSWKVNQLQLYTEHTFAYTGHEVVWRGADPLTPEEIRQLDAHCQERFVDLVPNQNSFGHFHRWLVHEPYRALAERPEGIEHPFSSSIEPFGLCPVDPGSVQLLEDLYSQLLPNFSSAFFNVGLDETIDLGTGRSKADCEARGKSAVYLDFLRRIHGLAAAHGRRIQFWADIVNASPELIPELPEDAVPLLWGYEAGHPFAEEAAPFSEAGCDFYLCPGTSAWNSFAGRWDNALANLAEAAIAGEATGAAGYLITDWGDFGHLQPLVASYPGWVAGAAFGWNADSARDPASLPAAALLDRFAFDAPGSGLGSVALDLANAYLDPGPRPKNASTLFHLVVFPEDSLEAPRYAGLSREGLERANDSVLGAARALTALTPEGSEAQLARDELLWIAQVLSSSCRLGLTRFVDDSEQEMARTPPAQEAAFEAFVDGFRSLWLARNRQGELDASAARLDSLAHLFRA